MSAARYLRREWLAVVGALLAAVAAAVTGMASLGHTRTLVYVPLLAGIGIALGVLALTRFAAFVYLLIGSRTVLDILKLSGPSAGNNATDTVSARGLDPSTIVGVLFLVAALLWLTAQYARTDRVATSRLRLAWVLFILASALSIFGSQEIKVSLVALVRLMSVGAMFLVWEQLIYDTKTLRAGLIAAFSSMVFPLGYTLYGFLTHHPAADIKSSYVRITGPFTQSTTFARYLAFFVVFGIAILPYVKGRWKWVLWGTVGLSGVFLLLTLSRGAILATGLGLVLVAVMQRRWKELALLVTVGLLGITLLPGVWSRLSAVTQAQAVGAPPDSNSLQWRLSYWSETLPLADKNPVNGIGLDMTTYQTDQSKQPHNDFIKAYVETGLAGLAAYAFLCWQIVAVGVRAVKATARGTFHRGIAVGYLVCAVMFVLQSVAANIISANVVLWYLAVFAGAALAVTRLAGSARTPIPIIADRPAQLAGTTSHPPTVEKI